MDGTLQFVNYKVGGHKNRIALLKPNIYFSFFVWTYFFMHTKPGCMTQFHIFQIFVENSVDSKQPKSEIHKEMPMFEQLKNQVLMNSKIFWSLIRKVLIIFF